LTKEHADAPTTGSGRWIVGDGSRLWDTARAIAVERADAGTTLRLRLPEPPSFLPGQYYLVRVATPAPPGSIQQSYSVSSSPFPPSPDIELAVRAVAGGRASPTLAHAVEPGDLLQVRGPFGDLTWTEVDGGPVVLVGGGSGVAPLASIVRYGAAHGATTPMVMLSSSRTRATALLREPLEALGRDHAWFRLAHTFTRDPAEPHGRFHRRIDAAMLGDVLDETGTDVTAARCYVAGPPDLVSAVRADLVALGASDRSIVTEDHA